MLGFVTLADYSFSTLEYVTKPFDSVDTMYSGHVFVLITTIDFTRIELVVYTLVNGVSPIIDDFCNEAFSCFVCKRIYFSIKHKNVSFFE